MYMLYLVKWMTPVSWRPYYMSKYLLYETQITPSEVILELFGCLKIQCNFRHCFLFPICQPLQQWSLSMLDFLFKNVSKSRRWQIGNRKQCLKFHWIFKQLKNSKTSSESVKYQIRNICTVESLFFFSSREYSSHWLITLHAAKNVLQFLLISAHGRIPYNMV